VLVGNKPFGVESASSLEPAKDLIFPSNLIQTSEGDDLYKRSHGSYAPGEQRHRGYNWNLDPDKVRFGAKGDTIAFNGVSKNIADVLNGSANAANQNGVVNTKKVGYYIQFILYELVFVIHSFTPSHSYFPPITCCVPLYRCLRHQVEDFRNMADMLGQSKNLGQDSGKRPADLVYGKASGSKGLSAAEVLRGKYKEADNLPDRDLGKSITPGFRNLSFTDRVFGCPSIRNDIPHPDVQKRSIADSQNYGDDVPAQDLINPPAFSDLAIGPMSLSELRDKTQMLQLFARIGYELNDALGSHLFSIAAQGGDYATINEFRNVLNDFIIREQLQK
jgi:EF-hand domain-containing family member B